MEVAKITSRGQITIPIDVRKKLGLKEGDKVIFIRKATTSFLPTPPRLLLGICKRRLRVKPKG